MAGCLQPASIPSVAVATSQQEGPCVCCHITTGTSLRPPRPLPLPARAPAAVLSPSCTTGLLFALKQSRFEPPRLCWAKAASSPQGYAGPKPLRASNARLGQSRFELPTPRRTNTTRSACRAVRQAGRWMGGTSVGSTDSARRYASVDRSADWTCGLWAKGYGPPIPTNQVRQQTQKATAWQRRHSPVESRHSSSY